LLRIISLLDDQLKASAFNSLGPQIAVAIAEENK
jgi:hypothetical protein